MAGQPKTLTAREVAAYLRLDAIQARSGGAPSRRQEERRGLSPTFTTVTSQGIPQCLGLGPQLPLQSSDFLLCGGQSDT